MFTYITDTLKQHLSFVVIVMFIICIFNDDPHNTNFEKNDLMVQVWYQLLLLLHCSLPSFHRSTFLSFTILLTFHFYWRTLLHQLSITWSTWIGWMQQRTLLIVCLKNWIKHSLTHSTPLLVVIHRIEISCEQRTDIMRAVNTSNAFGLFIDYWHTL